METSEGEITLELFEDDAPNTAANFVHLTGAGFYDGTLFHRVVKGYMMQGGDPLTRRPDEARWGTGGPGYRIEDERPKNPGWKHERGMVSMASAGPHTAGSQFFIVFGAAAHCDGQYTVFGRVVDGMAVVDRIDQTLATELTGKPKKPIELRRARVVRRRDHAYRPITLPPLR
ncbi:MAG: peptidylprolyl isomerase [Candidatus Riflebacteria bacterium]|nr:peptidylprolyl isomerase [Candidatus Riflebacteria bacterium]